jgi:hypothetical protein
MTTEDLNLELLNPKDFPAYGKFCEKYTTFGPVEGVAVEEDYAAVADADVAYANELAAQNREDQLRQLLSYFREEAGSGQPLHAVSMAEAEAAGSLEAYADAATKLAAILDGEG